MIIYMVKNKINNKVYFGQTTNKSGFKGRYANNYPKNCSNEHIKSSIEKYGWDNFEVVEEFDRAETLEELNELEEMYIKMWNTYDRNYGYNKKYGGNNHHGQEVTEEQKRKISEAMKGREFTEEHKQHLSEALKGKPKSDKQKKEHSERMKGENNPMYGKHPIGSMKGKHHSEETKKKISEGNKNKTISEETRNKIKNRDYNWNKRKVICLNNGIVYNSIKEASIILGINASGITSCCQGRYKQTKGYKFEYYGGE